MAARGAGPVPVAGCRCASGRWRGWSSRVKRSRVAGWILLGIPSALLIVPLPWWFAAVCRWFCRNLLFRDGARAEFRGRGGEIFGWLLLTAVGVGIGWAPFPGVHIRLVHIGNGFLLSLIGLYGQWRVVRWC